MEAEPPAYRSKVAFVLEEVDFLAGDWTTSATVYRIDGKLVVGRLVIRPNLHLHPADPPVPGIGNRVLREVHVGDLLDEALKDIMGAPEQLRVVRDAFPHLVEEQAQLAADEALCVTPERGRPPKGDAFYRGVTVDYLQLQADGLGRRVIIELARLYSERRGEAVPIQTARHWVYLARQKGFLGGSTRGRGGGGHAWATGSRRTKAATGERRNPHSDTTTRACREGSDRRGAQCEGVTTGTRTT